MKSETLISEIHKVDKMLMLSTLAPSMIDTRALESELDNLLEMLIGRIFDLWNIQETSTHGFDEETDLDRELNSLIAVAKEFKLGSF